MNYISKIKKAYSISKEYLSEKINNFIFGDPFEYEPANYNTLEGRVQAPVSFANSMGKIYEQFDKEKQK